MDGWYATVSGPAERAAVFRAMHEPGWEKGLHEA